LGLFVTPAGGVWGSTFSLTGVLRAGGAALGGRIVRLQRRLASEDAFRDLRLATTSADGLFVVQDRPAESARYRALFEGEAGRGALPPVAAAVVRHGVALNVPAAPVAVESVAVLGGAVLPPNRGGRVALQRFSPGSGWRTIATATLDAHSRYSFRVRKRSAGFLLFRVAAPSGRLWAWNVSANRGVEWTP
ncbi:MAG: hypothetical protein ACREN5_06885, partial [Gemmatimonadales bacterium]